METKMIDKDIKIELIPTKYIEIDKVKKADYNPRKINKKDFENLKNSIKKAGCIRDLVINKRTNTLVSGHQTLDACKELGYKILPYKEIDVDLKTEKALNIAINKIQGDWDYDLLSPMLSELNNGNILDITGFDVSDVDMMERLSDDGSLVSDLPPEEVKVPTYNIIFDFDDETDMVAVKRYFSNCRSGWKDKNRPNSKLLKEIVDKNV